MVHVFAAFPQGLWSNQPRDLAGVQEIRDSKKRGRVIKKYKG